MTLIKSKFKNLFHIFPPLAQFSHSNHYILSGPTNYFNGITYTLVAKFRGSCVHIIFCTCCCASQKLTTAQLQSQSSACSYHISLHLSATEFLFIQNPKAPTVDPLISFHHSTFVWQFPTHHLHLNLHRQFLLQKSIQDPHPQIQTKN